MTVVTDTTAVTTLLKAGEERLLREIFGTVTVPDAVWNELLAFHSHLPDFVLRRPVQEPNQRLAGTELLGRGEAEAIKLAQEINADLLLIDDRKARAAATDLGIKCSGLARASRCLRAAACARKDVVQFRKPKLQYKKAKRLVRLCP